MQPKSHIINMIQCPTGNKCISFESSREGAITLCSKNDETNVINCDIGLLCDQAGVLKSLATRSEIVVDIFVACANRQKMVISFNVNT